MTEQQVFTKRRKIANWALALSFICYLASLYLTISFHESAGASIFKAVAEAALVGGVADWFAVTALFRKPLGFSYHTALIPRNRERMARAMAAMVQNEL
ncbi:MAG: DUF445 family protein, partial [Sporomusaceae bacterium]|nr:DUF445 family protein [Sporomusaceae bacterium]